MNKKGALIVGAVSLSLILSGCFQGEQSLEQEMDPPQDAEAVNSLEDSTSENKKDNVESKDSADSKGKKTKSDDAVTEMVPRELYLMDKNGMVAAQTIELPGTSEVGKQLMEHLVKDGPVTPLLPNGFQAVLPEGTEILGLNLKEDGTIIVDVSEEFKNYEPNEEIKILESMTYTLTQFENVKKVQLWINGHPQEEMPVNGTPIGNGYARANGINVVESNSNDLLTATPVTMFYPSEHNENRYYVPVTQYVDSKEDVEIYEAIVDSLIQGPGYNSNIVHVFNEGTKLSSEPVMKDGVLKLIFNEGILKDKEQSVISDEVMETLVRTLTEQAGVKAVDVKVENVDQLVNENGESYEEPVTKDTFTKTEKL
ncbi:GerMN domain-containing protein [Oceanobacillus caeni]|uniref:Spore gernimation protein n=1 Tax=Oceanobacillus caeni TaxID=405946 RepID=A0ABR5MFD9_9BACI|nr:MULTISPECIES: GerMN domain-containing protein [Bacillaceae]KKE80498.1 spore gernimation protein [Bacilli bacterium VT-13-104]PZD87730.1 spore gernimation protein [Bacilli bacterium]KPH70527.1 spore gernimation protein [Oceanobacillus caeni]MBU8789572.1 GerMN domain-containing protein [Oceanobacillus caeni]MCR1835938.1 GerMN domain-containing protein [Oceanobacillus caeni]